MLRLQLESYSTEGRFPRVVGVRVLSRARCTHPTGIELCLFFFGKPPSFTVYGLGDFVRERGYPLRWVALDVCASLHPGLCLELLSSKLLYETMKGLHRVFLFLFYAHPMRGDR